ncbi:ribbon-helix-helix protein, CopG family [archaeon]|nr:ribbon-helix-helix protein, CopG family [archaeon]
MLKQYAITIDPKLMKKVDEAVKKDGLYHSRNDFVRDAIRAKLVDLEWKLGFRASVKKMREKALGRGWDGKLLTKEEKDKIALDYMKELGFIKSGLGLQP